MSFIERIKQKQEEKQNRILAKEEDYRRNLPERRKVAKKVMQPLEDIFQELSTNKVVTTLGTVLNFSYEPGDYLGAYRIYYLTRESEEIQVFKVMYSDKTKASNVIFTPYGSMPYPSTIAFAIKHLEDLIADRCVIEEEQKKGAGYVL